MAPALATIPPSSQLQSSKNGCPFTPPSLFSLLLNDDVHLCALAVFALAVIARYVNSFLPRRRLMRLETTLEEIKNTLVAVQESSLDREFVLDTRLALDILRFDVCALHRETVHITSFWQDICAFFKGFSSSLKKCSKYAAGLKIRIEAQIERDKQLVIKAEVNEMLLTFINKSDVIEKPLPCVFSAKSNLHGCPTIRATGTFQPSDATMGIVQNTHPANKGNSDV